jgi:signal transduction histidine kinase
MEVIDSTRASLEELERKLAQLEETNRLKDEFLGNLGHELGNLFLPYQFALQLLQQGRADQSTVEQVRAMLEEHAANVQRFMDDLRTVSRIVRRKLHAQHEPIDLKNVVERAVDRLRPQVEKDGHQLSVSLPAQAEPFQGDPQLLDQMVDHLLRNAVKFTNPGGHIWVSLAREDGEIVLRVRDTGVGIAPELIPRIFTLFVKADPLSGGSGTGLGIVRAVAELHGGHAAAISPGQGQGSEFIVRLPA